MLFPLFPMASCHTHISCHAHNSYTIFVCWSSSSCNQPLFTAEKKTAIGVVQGNLDEAKELVSGGVSGE